MKYGRSQTALALAFCASFASCAKFQGKRAPDVASFIAYTEFYVAETDTHLGTPGGASLWPYLQARDAEVQQLVAAYEDLSEVGSEVRRYSLSVAAVSNPKFPQSDAPAFFARELGELVARLRDDHRIELDVAPDQVQDALRVAAGERELLAALGTMQPVVYAVARAIDERVEELLELESSLAVDLDADLHDDYRAVLELDRALAVRRAALLSALLVVERHAPGTELPDDLDLAGLGHEASTPSGDRDAVWAILNSEAQTARSRREALEPELARFEAQRTELWSLVDRDEQNLRGLRRSVLGWALAHQVMATGYRTPAEWFQLTDPYSAVRGPAPSR